MSVVRDWLVAEFDHETAITRRVLERAPAAAWTWTPHERSRPLGGLATHLALIPHWGRAILDHDGYDLALSGPPAPAAAGPADALARFDAHVADVRRELARRTDAELEAPWTLRSGSRDLVSLPRFAALRTFLLSHLVHHRGQMTVYLRLCGVPLPPIYGPSADESP